MKRTGVVLLLGILAGWPCASLTAAEPILVRVGEHTLNPVRAGLFGQFMERATWGEPGPEAAYVPTAPFIQPAALALLEKMNIPVIRFPGGTDIDYIDWRDMIDRVPGRDSSERPITTGHTGGTLTNRFGYDEYFALRDHLKNETILVLNLLDAIARRKPLRQAALDAVGLVAYANAPQGATLPAGMPDWPTIRAQNGHPASFQAEYVQLGNELWAGDISKALAAAMPDANESEKAQWITECVRTYVRMIREIDPTIKIMIDDRCVHDAQDVYLDDPLVRREVAYATFHVYAPWDAGLVKVNRQPVPPDRLDDNDWWACWTGMPGIYTSEGLADGLSPATRQAAEKGYRLACTEWNWNGWFKDRKMVKPAINYATASGLGAAAFLHNLMRNGDTVDLATQSMLIGSSWGITAVRIDPADDAAPYYLPQGQVTGFYSRHHGDQRVSVTTSSIPTLKIEVDGYEPQSQGALLDVVATRDAHKIYLHLLYRGLHEPGLIRLDLSALKTANRMGTINTLSGDPYAKKSAAYGQSAFVETSQKQPLDKLVELPPASVSVLEIPVKADF